MQELYFPDITVDADDPFDDYPAAQAALTKDKHTAVVWFTRVDANSKHHYLVAERYWAVGQKWRITNAKEFKHARDRAQRYYRQRKVDLAAE